MSRSERNAAPPPGGARRAVITGIGVVAPGGIGTRAYWDLLTAGRSATRAVTRFDASMCRSRIAGECDFDPVREGLSPLQALRLDRAAQFAVVASREAVASSGLDLAAVDPHRAAVVLGCAAQPDGAQPDGAQPDGAQPDGALPGGALADGPLPGGALADGPLPGGALRSPGIAGGGTEPAGRPPQDHRALDADPAGRRDGPGADLPRAARPSTATELATLMGATGPVRVVASSGTAGLDAVGQAAQLVVEGAADLVLAGGTEAPLSTVMFVCFDLIGATTSHNDDPTGACRPFDRTRDGLVLAEGAAVLVVEELGHARRRGAHVFAEVAGYASRCDPFHRTTPDPDARELSEAIDAALGLARVDPSALDCVSAHGSGIRQDDVYETRALKRSLRRHAYRVPISGIKSMIGHSLGAVGALEIAGCLLALERGVIAPTANLHEPDPACDLDYVPLAARQQRVDTALTVGSGFGGFQSAMVLRRVDGAAHER